MVGTIFNFAKVSTVPCMFTPALSWIVSIRLDSLACIESIIDETNVIEQIENNKLFKVKTITSTRSRLLHPFVL